MNRFIIFGASSMAAVIAVLAIINYQQQIDQILGHPNSANYLTLMVLVAQSSLVFLEIGEIRQNKTKKQEIVL